MGFLQMRGRRGLFFPAINKPTLLQEHPQRRQCRADPGHTCSPLPPPPPPRFSFSHLIHFSHMFFQRQNWRKLPNLTVISFQQMKSQRWQHCDRKVRRVWGVINAGVKRIQYIPHQTLSFHLQFTHHCPYLPMIFQIYREVNRSSQSRHFRKMPFSHTPSFSIVF